MTPRSRRAIIDAPKLELRHPTTVELDKHVKQSSVLGEEKRTTCPQSTLILPFDP
jgi:hypothetical protein